MKFNLLGKALAIVFLPTVLYAADQVHLEKIQQLQIQARALQEQLQHLQREIAAAATPAKKNKTIASAPRSRVLQKTKRPPPGRKTQTLISPTRILKKPVALKIHSTSVQVHTFDGYPESSSFFPTALIADGEVVTYIAGTPVVTSPYLGDRPAFDGSDYIVNISSINRDIRLMQQRRRLYRAYESMGYSAPNKPIIAISGKSEPVGMFNSPYLGPNRGDLTLGSSELDVAAALNDKVEAFMSIAYDETPPPIGGQRVANSSFDLNTGFVNIGNLDSTPYYFTAGQMYVPFGRYSSAMISSPLTLRLTRTKARPFILGYKSQYESGPFMAIYGFKSDTTDGHSGVAGFNWGYTIKTANVAGEIGASYIGTIADSRGLQGTGSAPFTTFGGFGSPTNGSEAVGKVPGAGVHGSISFDRYNLTAEWVTSTKSFNAEDLSFNGHGARVQAIQLEAGMTFMVFDKPASLAAGYQAARQTLALNIPKDRISGVFNISIWKDTVESLEYRHDRDFNRNQYANGAAPLGLVNQTTIGTGSSSDAIIAQIGVYF